MQRKFSFRYSAPKRSGRLLTAGSIIVALSLSAVGCASDNNSPGWLGAFAAQMSGAPSLDQIVEKIGKQDQAASVVELKTLIESAGVSQSTKQEASYVLGKLLKKTWSPAGTGFQTDENYNSMVSLFKTAAKSPALAPRAQKQLLDISTKAADDAQIRESLRNIKALAKTPDDKAFADYTLAQNLLKAGETDNARQLFLAIRENAPTSKYAYGALYYLGDDILKTNQSGAPEAFSQASSLFKEYLKVAPDGRFASEIAARLEAMASDPNTASVAALSPADYDAIARAYYNAGNFTSALNAWSKADPGKNLFMRSIALARTNHVPEAQATLIRAIKNDPSSKSYITAATIIGNPLTKAQTIDLWRDCLAAGPKYADTALWNVATRANENEGPVLFRELIKKYPTSEFAAESSWWLFWHEVKGGDKKRYPAAIALGKETTQKYPITRQAARLLFWIGKLHERLGQRDMALSAYAACVERFPSNYYGYRAHHRLQALKPGGYDAGWSTKVARKHPQPNWNWPEPEIPETKGDTDSKFDPTFLTFYRLNQWDECLELFPSSGPRELKSAMLAKNGQNLEAIGAASRDANGKALKTAIWQASYPLEFGEYVAENAAQRGVDPLLVHALIREESRYNPKALSRSHALGLMQLLPGTAYGAAKNVGITLSGESDVYRPEVNVKLGTFYLGYAIKRFNGNAMLGVASYNGGPGAVTGFMRRHTASGSGDFDQFVENIPFRETRDYVRKVFGSYWTYQAMYTGK